VRYEFDKTGPEPFGGGTGRLMVGGATVAEGEITRACPIGYTIDGTFGIGWDKGTPASAEYGLLTRFTGTIIRVDFELHPDLHSALTDPEKQAEQRFVHAMIRQ
jgi:hypothetical protein